MAQFCSACGAAMADGSATCSACGKTTATTTGSSTATQGGLTDNVAGLLSYLFIPAIIFLVMEPYSKNPFIRFHAFQGLFLGLASIVGHMILSFIPVLGWIIIPFFSLAIFVLAIIAAVKAYQGQRWHVPIVGDLAEKQATAA